MNYEVMKRVYNIIEMQLAQLHSFQFGSVGFV